VLNSARQPNRSLVIFDRRVVRECAWYRAGTIISIALKADLSDQSRASHSGIEQFARRVLQRDGNGVAVTPDWAASRDISLLVNLRDGVKLAT
jgi:hypothetical protein